MRKMHPIRQYRKANKLTPEAFGAKLGKSGPTVISWENGNRTVQAEDAVRIEKEYGIDRAALRKDLFSKAA